MEGSLSFRAHHLKRIEKFLRYDSPPPNNHPIDTILVLGTSKSIDPRSFELRIATALNFSQQYPEAQVVFSGKHPDVNRALPHELAHSYREAAVMAEEAVRRGLAKKRIVLETESKNTRENVMFSLNQIPIGDNILIVCSAYVGRRVSLYLKRMQQEYLIPERNYFIVDADVRLDYSGKTLDQQHHVRKNNKTLYEWERLVKYRRKGHL